MAERTVLCREVKRLQRVEKKVNKKKVVTEFHREDVESEPDLTVPYYFLDHDLGHT